MTAKTRTSICTICGEPFQQEVRPGRPSLFCSEEHRAIGKTTRERTCKTCGNTFEFTTNPYYCSEACRTMTSCLVCASPCKSRFCSAKCLMQYHAPPYTCQRCGSKFTPTKLRNLNRPPKFCSVECYDEATTFMPGNTRGNFEVDMVLLDNAMHRWQATGLEINAPLPTRPNGAPWPAPDHIMVNKWMPMIPNRERNAIDFWNFVLSDPPVPMLRNYAHIAEYMMYGCLWRGVAGRDSLQGIMHGWGIFPWVAAHNRWLPQGKILRLADAYRKIEARNRKGSRKDIANLIYKAEGAFYYAIGLSPDATQSERKEMDRFVNAWLRPVKGVGETRLYQAVREFQRTSFEPNAQFLFPGDKHGQKKFDEIVSIHDELNAWAVDAIFGKGKRLPWGPRYKDSELKLPEARLNAAIQKVLSRELQIGK